MNVSRRLWYGIFISVVGFGLLAGSPLAAQQTAATSRPRIDVSRLGPQVGQTVPDFSLTDQNGKVWTRSSIMGPLLQDTTRGRSNGDLLDDSLESTGSGDRRWPCAHRSRRHDAGASAPRRQNVQPTCT